MRIKYCHQITWRMFYPNMKTPTLGWHTAGIYEHYFDALAIVRKIITYHADNYGFVIDTKALDRLNNGVRIPGFFMITGTTSLGSEICVRYEEIEMDRCSIDFAARDATLAMVAEIKRRNSDN